MAMRRKVAAVRGDSATKKGTIRSTTDFGNRIQLLSQRFSDVFGEAQPIRNCAYQVKNL